MEFHLSLQNTQEGRTAKNTDADGSGLPQRTQLRPQRTSIAPSHTKAYFWKFYFFWYPLDFQVPLETCSYEIAQQDSPFIIPKLDVWRLWG